MQFVSVFFHRLSAKYLQKFEFLISRGSVATILYLAFATRDLTSCLQNSDLTLQTCPSLQMKLSNILYIYIKNQSHHNAIQAT